VSSRAVLPRWRSLYDGPAGGDVTSRVWIEVTADGSLVVGTQDIGDSLERIFGVDEHEWMEVVPPGHHLPATFAQLAAMLDGNPTAASAFRDWCAANGVPVRTVVVR
jgi:hypothetical protein